MSSEGDTCMSSEENTCISSESSEGNTCMSSKGNTCISSEGNTCMSSEGNGDGAQLILMCLKLMSSLLSLEHLLKQLLALFYTVSSTHLLFEHQQLLTFHHGAIEADIK
jgi:hypothetical protein